MENVVCKCLDLNVLTKNGRWYSTEEVQKAIDKMDFETNQYYCTLGSSHAECDIAKITHQVLSLVINKDETELIATMKPLKTRANSLVINCDPTVHIAIHCRIWDDDDGTVTDIRILYLFYAT